MAPLKDMDLIVLPPESVDCGTQRCRMGPTLMTELGLKLGSPLLILLPEGACICTAWPRSDLAEGYLQFHTTCATSDFNSQRFSQLRLAQLKPLTCSRLKCLRANVLVQSAEYKRTTSSQFVQELAKELLTGLYVHEKHLVNLASSGTQIQFVEVENVNSGSHKAGLVSADTFLDLGSVQTVKQYQRKQKTPVVQLGGAEEVYAPLREMLTLPLHYPESLRRLGLACPRGALLVGPPGVGKTQLVRSVAQEAGASLVTVSGPVVVGSRPGESEENLRRAFAQAQEAARDGPCILFMDEVDALCPRRSGSSSAPENRLVAQLLTLMDGIGSDEGFVIIAATNQPDALDPALRRPGRFDREVVMGVPTLKQRFQILECVSQSVPLSPSVDLMSLAEMTTGYVGADLSALCREAALQAILHTAQGEASEMGSKDGSVDMVHFHRALRLVPPSCLRSGVGVVDFKPVSWEQIGGLEDVKLKLKQSIEWPMKFPEALVRMGVCRPRGVLLYGPPGCAKTTLVKAAASSSHCTFLTVSGAQLYAPYVGDSGRALAQLFRQARACSPSIVFLDEIDSMVGSRGEDSCQGGVQAQVLSMLLNELDGVGFKPIERRGSARTTLQAQREEPQPLGEQQMELQELCNKDVMIVAATNRPDALDSALLRPGRLDHIIYVPPPDTQARLAILQLHTEKMPLNCDVCLKDLATQTQLFSGADLENLCKEAALLALHEEGMSVSCVKQKYFLGVLQRVSPSLSPHQLLQYQQVSSWSQSSS
ncbi:spermatogenesis-associated protein 5-like protein 1 [Electrophorus electricus]|uniref:AAA+ ATPase domain-containing protein n=1 Tax=Electrophorus electricus TaxID=8005 RepID=A0A4W4HIN1_ELEEL|nr:spermatogenesis-associated protein 5-like protein 1 [Electrophorus electricus]XP_026878596.2 spermatogenesis-associated protein 5-like protein 1 [Electrophorus electricus]XP_026878597.2 spermatogenesis-associated protein 5-like protein 1 [Electrophorus electricus]